MKQLIFLLAVSILILGGCRQHEIKRPVSVIFDTDMGPDYDDVGALTMLHALADNGEAEILATVSSNMYRNSVPCIEVLNFYFGRPDLLVGAPKAGVDIIDPRFGENYWPELLPGKYPHRTKSTADAADAVEIYRRVLSSQPDTSVRIITVGFLTNLAGLLQSAPDEYSDLSGKELVSKKVKSLTSMAGFFPEGREFNVYSDSVASEIVFSQWPTPVLLSGFEIGDAILTGKRLVASDIQDSPVKEVYSMCLAVDVNGRCSWDQTAVLVGVRGYVDYFNVVKGYMHVNPDGSNTWTDDSKGRHARLTWKMPQEQLQQVIEELMMHQP